MSGGRPPANATDQQLAEDWHRYVARPGGKPAPGVTSIIKPLTNADTLAQGKAKQTAAIAAELQFPGNGDDGWDAWAIEDILYEHRDALKARYATWKPWQHKRWAKIDLLDDQAVYFDWLRGEVTRRWNAKRDTGSVVHDAIYPLSRGIATDIPHYANPYLDAWERYVEENGVEFVPEWTERVVLHPDPLGRPELEYGGRDDLFAIHHKGPLAGMICGDYKTGGKYPSQVTLQLAAYRFGRGFALYDDAGTLTDYERVPEVDHAVGIYLHDDGTYDAWEAPADAEAWETFLLLREVHNFADRMKPHEKAAEKAWKEKQSA